MKTDITEGLIRVLLPERGKRGMLAVLEFYFDDSGSHAGSPVVVWGGIVGHTQFVNELAAKWQNVLDAPCDGKPPIEKFHSTDLMNGWGEFVGYNQAERDLTRRNFRQAILDAGLTILSYGLSTKDWDQVVNGTARQGLISPEHTVFGVTVRHASSIGGAEGQPIAFVFDQGCASRFDLQAMFMSALQSAGIDPSLASYAVSPVLGSCALQAADLVAHETYRYFCDYLHDDAALPPPHLKKLHEGAHDFRAGWLGRDELKEASDDIAAWIDKLGQGGGL